ncbi:hypothetical protein RND81_04G085800 [Saponaria officinalis]|uniref:S-protein homolog n=1 Tax=Saponaria officinalis TaxID=3572 RepID=A0AAW1LJ55_SAPOF
MLKQLVFIILSIELLTSSEVFVQGVGFSKRRFWVDIENGFRNNPIEVHCDYNDNEIGRYTIAPQNYVNVTFKTQPKEQAFVVCEIIIPKDKLKSGPMLVFSDYFGQDDNFVAGRHLVWRSMVGGIFRYKFTDKMYYIHKHWVNA